MLRSIQPLQFLLTLLAGWINRRQLEAIEYLKATIAESLFQQPIFFLDARPSLLLAAWLTLTTISGDPTAAGCMGSPLPHNWQFATNRLTNVPTATLRG